MSHLAKLYLDQLKKSLVNALNRELPESLLNPASPEELTQPSWFEHFWAGSALTMSSMRRLDHLQACMEDCLDRGIPGDFVECGVWRGGAAILMRGVLAAHEIEDRTIWAADSFQGLPTPDQDSIDNMLFNLPPVVAIERFAVSLESVQNNFERYGLLDERVRFLAGWFQDTLPQAPIDRIAVLRLDGDFYRSTMDTLVHLYPRVSPGGYVIVDDWGISQVCGEQAAVIDYRKEHGIEDEIVEVDWHASCWQKSG